MARDTRSLEGAAFVAYQGAWPVPIREADQISRLRQALVSGDFFEVLGGQPELGRLLRIDDDRVGAAPAAVLSHGAWQTMVVQRTREFGVRMARGASGGDLRTMVLQRGLSLAIVGLVIGLLVALIVNRLLVALLYGVSPSDPLTMAVVALAFLAIATPASLIPAHSSARINPATALRAEG